MMEELDLEVAGEFLVMAATLVYIKSRMLLPPEPTEEQGFEEDPRASLVDMLAEYQRFRTASEEFAVHEDGQRQYFLRSEPVELPPTGAPLEINLADLLDAFRAVLTRAKDRPVLELMDRPLTTGERMVAILDRLALEEPVTFEALFPSEADRALVIVTFLGLLELIRQGAVRVWQTLSFGEILIARAVS
ncbi:MAG: segregation and condensation protein A, partial [Candidatus Methylomirabilales bacterium]